MAGQPETQTSAFLATESDQMDPQAKILWDFLETAFRTGLLDKVIDLAGIVASKDMDDMSKAFDSLEDIFLNMEDTAAMEEKFDIAYQAMAALTDEDIMDGLESMVTLIMPILRLVKMQSGIQDLLTPEKIAVIQDKSANLARAFVMIGTTGVKMYMTRVAGKSAREYGQELGRVLNQFTNLSNEIADGVSGGTTGFMAGIFDEIDGEALRHMTDAMTDGFLAQRPPITKWMASTAFKMAKSRLTKR